VSKHLGDSTNKPINLTLKVHNLDHRRRVALLRFVSTSKELKANRPEFLNTESGRPLFIFQNGSAVEEDVKALRHVQFNVPTSRKTARLFTSIITRN
jgi:hypothetical protein